ncbi:MAG: sigma-54-dependent Fis family transcriptional regulator [Polyangiaceae bacterium]|nr:sigma-54-dependent Fis family transcriptional regulator [Polyangiaceae bacterium]
MPAASSSLPTTGYLLAEAPGVIRATTVANESLRAGSRIEEAIGIGWRDLVEVAASSRELVTPAGRFRLETMRGANEETVAVLLVLEEAQPRYTTTTVPPASATRPTLGIDIVGGKDTAARGAVDLAMRLAKTMLPIYIACEEGSGAEIVARAIVDASGRGQAPFVHISADAVPSDQFIELLLAAGPQCAGGGTLYVENVHDLDLETGRRLAREVDRGVYADAHFVASGRGDLRERVARGTFARELYTLLRTSTVTLPALRDRDDFEYVVRGILAHLGGQPPNERIGSGRSGSSPPSSRFEVAPETMRVLRSYAWPNNVRELAAWLERAIASAAPERLILPGHLPLEAAEPAKSEGAPMSQGLRHVAERSALEEALRAANGNVSLAAKKLGVARSTLYRMKQRHKVEP